VTFGREQVYDPILRLVHAWNGFAVLFLIATSQVADWVEHTPDEAFAWTCHIWAGYALVLGLVGRLIWGIVGPPYARFSDMWHPRAWVAVFRTRILLPAPAAFGHHPLASSVYLAMYGVLITMAITGLALGAIQQTTGPLVPWLADAVWYKGIFREPHEALQNVVIGFVLVHIAALILHERLHRAPLAQSMVTGHQYLRRDGR
jgi:cytochrome b